MSSDDVSSQLSKLTLAMRALVENVDSGAFKITVLDDGEEHLGNIDHLRELLKEIDNEDQGRDPS